MKVDQGGQRTLCEVGSGAVAALKSFARLYKKSNGENTRDLQFKNASHRPK